MTTSEPLDRPVSLQARVVRYTVGAVTALDGVSLHVAQGQCVALVGESGAGKTTLLLGAGGLGEPIVTGLALADTRMVLSGALPAAALALLVDGVLALVERRVAPAHRRRRPRKRTTAVQRREVHP